MHNRTSEHQKNLYNIFEHNSISGAKIYAPLNPEKHNRKSLNMKHVINCTIVTKQIEQHEIKILRSYTIKTGTALTCNVKLKYCTLVFKVLVLL